LNAPEPPSSFGFLNLPGLRTGLGFLATLISPLFVAPTSFFIGRRKHLRFTR